MKSGSTCYFCGAPATSEEHVPPKAIFPKPKDSPDGRDYRKGLWKVPSCELHNSATSKDDEYLLYVSTMSLASNSLGTHHFLTKVRRAIAERPLLIQRIIHNAKQVWVVDTHTGKQFRTYAFQPDAARLNAVYEKIARGIEYRERGARWAGSVSVLVESEISFDDADSNRLREFISLANDRLFRDVPAVGLNPEAFRYQRLVTSEDVQIRMFFYGDVRVVATLAS